MARWETGTRTRLGDAALELFSTQGFEGTTVEQIAAAAGVTARTFFRYFVDKEEVLFSGDAAMEQFLVARVTEVLGHEPPRQATLVAVRALATGFEPDRGEHVRRTAVLEQNPRLRGRQLLKQERWGLALVAVLEDGGVDPTEARLAVGRSALVFSLSYGAWCHGAPETLLALMDRYDARLG